MTDCVPTGGAPQSTYMTGAAKRVPRGKGKF
jgi:fatty acid desaturase